MKPFIRFFRKIFSSLREAFSATKQSAQLKQIASSFLLAKTALFYFPKKSIYICILLQLLWLNTFAQQETKPLETKIAFTTYALTQPTLFDYKNVNTVLTTENVATLPLLHILKGFGGNVKINNVYVGVDALPFSRRVKKSTIRNSSAAVYSFSYELYTGYRFWHNNKLGLYTLASAGYLQSTAVVTVNIPNRSFTSTLHSSGNAMTVDNHSAFFNLSLGGDYYTGKTTKNSRVITIRVGYKYATKTNEWNSDYIDFTNTPVDKLSQFYMQVGFGLITYVKTQKPQKE